MEVDVAPDPQLFDDAKNRFSDFAVKDYELSGLTTPTC
jgi:hypothetical protein